MDPTTFLASLPQLGLGGIVFAIWYFDNKKITGLQDVLKEQVEDKRLMREERGHLIKMIEDHARLTQRATSVLERLEANLRRK